MPAAARKETKPNIVTMCSALRGTRNLCRRELALGTTMNVQNLWRIENRYGLWFSYAPISAKGRRPSCAANRFGRMTGKDPNAANATLIQSGLSSDQFSIKRRRGRMDRSKCGLFGRCTLFQAIDSRITDNFRCRIGILDCSLEQPAVG